MKFTCSQKDFSSNLISVGRVIPTRPTHPILGNALVVADQGNQKIDITGFDLNLGLCISFTAEVEVGGQIVMPAKLLREIISRLPNGDITIESANNSVILTSQTGKYEIQGMGAEEFPSLPEISSQDEVTMLTETLTDGLQGALFATSDDETRQVLTGLHIIVRRKTIEFAATDGHRLALVEIDNPIPYDETAKEMFDHEEFFEATIPARSLKELEKMMSQSEKLGIWLDPGQVVFKTVSQRLTSRTLEGKYPAYRQLIPTQFNCQVVVDRKQLLLAMERIAILAPNDVIEFKLDSDKQEVALSVEAQDVGSGRESVFAQITGEELTIGFNAKYAIESLKNLKSNEVLIKLNSANSAVIFTPLNGAKVIHLLMPVQRRN